MRSAEKVVLSRRALCKLAWVLRSRNGVSRADLLSTFDTLCRADNAIFDAAAYDAGVAMMLAGADFAVGVIAHEGAMLGGDEFVSFDKKAVAALRKSGGKAQLLDE